MNDLTSIMKGDYARTRASDFKHLPAVILNVFLVNILGLCLISLHQFKKLVLQCFFMNETFEISSNFC